MHQSLALAKRMALSREYDDLHKLIPTAPNPDQSIHGMATNPSPAALPQALFPPHLLNLATPSPTTTKPTLTTRAGVTAPGFAAPLNDAPLIGMPRP